ncbi:MAG: hypothetical protein LBO03_09275 [Acidaminococcales bacterium]|jgi:hypothetical protein|nr:hypothetical protein [Acidaminococcales bacterium]
MSEIDNRRLAMSDAGVARYEAKMREKDLEAFAFVLEDRRGRWLVARFAQENFRDRTTFRADAEAGFREGKRAAALVLFQRMRAAKERFGQLLLLAEAELWAAAEEAIRQAQKEDEDSGRG